MRRAFSRTVLRSHVGMLPALQAAMFCLLFLGCGREAESSANSASEPVEEVEETLEAEGTDPQFWNHFEKLGELSIEERDDVLLVEPIVVPDPRGGFFVVEPKENQVRMYSTTGELTAYFGRKGSGPGELDGPVMARRLPDGEIVVANVMVGRLQQYDPLGERLVTEHRAPGVQPIVDFLPLGGSRFVAARAGSTQESLFLIDSGVVLRSFMPLPSTERTQLGASTFGGVILAQHGDTIAAVHALADTVYLFDITGEALGTVALPFAEPASVQRQLPPEGRTPGPMAALAGVRRNMSLSWLDDGSFVLVTARQAPDRRITWGLLHATRSGTALFESARAPRLMTVLGETFYFRDDAQMEPGKWFPARVAR